MQFLAQKPRQAINKAFLKQGPTRSEIDHFKATLSVLLHKIDDNSLERSAENIVIEFLREAFYRAEGCEINAKDRIDVAIFSDDHTRSDAKVILEFKKPSERYDMPSRERDSFNVKALHELVLYYLRERIDEGNINITHLIVTNGYEYYFFDEKEFDKVFYRNVKLKKAYQDWQIRKKDTTHFYQEIVRPFVDSHTDTLHYTHLDLRQVAPLLSIDDHEADRKLIPVFKLFSPAHLLRKPFSNDSNTLDKSFYNELLYLIGLEENKEKGKKVIERVPEERRQPGSLLENTITVLKAEDRLRRVNNRSAYGETTEEQLVGVALDLSWACPRVMLRMSSSVGGRRRKRS